MSAIRRIFGFGDDDHTDRPPPPRAVPALRQSLADLVSRINASSGHLPVAAVVEARDIGDQLAQLLDHEERMASTRGGTDAYEMATVTAVIRDYLPTSLDTYLALPPSFRESHRSAEGLTPAEELADQLRLMKRGVTELAHAIYGGDARRLSVQGRFLDAKFASSELDR